MKKRWFQKQSYFTKGIAMLLSAALLAGGVGTAPIVSASSDKEAGTVQMEQSEKSGGMFRWWVVVGDPIDEENLFVHEDELQTIADNGYSGVEISVLASDGKDLNENGWGSKAWTNFLLHVFKKADELGLTVDMTVTCGWPISLPMKYLVGTDAKGNSFNYLEQNLYNGDYSNIHKEGDTLTVTTADGKESKGDTILYSDKGDTYTEATAADPLSSRSLQGVVAAKVVGSAATKKGQQYYVWGSANIPGGNDDTTSTLLDKESLQVLVEGEDYTLDESTGSIKLNWSPQEDGDYRVFTYWMGFSGASSNKGTEEMNYYIDYLNEDSVKQAYAKFIQDTILENEELAALIQKNGCSLFDDSIEFGSYFGADNLEWSSVLKENFKSDIGYDITKYLPLLEGQSMGGSTNVEYYTYEFATFDKEQQTYTYDASAESIRRDLSQEYTNSFERHIIELQDWAHQHNITYRAQEYSFNFDVAYLCAITDYPDTETVGFYDIETNGEKYQHGDDKCRLVASGAHMGDKNIISSECGAVNNRAYRMSWEKIMEYIQLQYALGTNRIIFHGFSSTLGGNAWPGYTGFSGLGDSWGTRNPSWYNQDDDQVAEYLSNAQTILQDGDPVIDVAVYNDHYGSYSPIWKDDTLENSGYSFDFISENLLTLDSAYVKDSVLAPGNGSYKAMIFNQQTYIDVETANKILSYENSGLPVIVIGNFPTTPSSYADYEAETAKLETIAEKIMNHSNTYVAENERDVVRALKAAGVKPDADPQADASQGNDLITAHRRTEQADYYYIYNDTKSSVKYGQDKDYVGEDGTIYSTDTCEGDDDQYTYLGKKVEDTITLQGDGTVFEIDLWTGEVKQLADYTSNSDGTVSIDVSLDYNESVMYAVAPSSLALTGVDKEITALDADSVVKVTGNTDVNAKAYADNSGTYVQVFKNGSYDVKSYKDGTTSFRVSDLPEELKLGEGYGNAKWSLQVNSWTGDEKYQYKDALEKLRAQISEGKEFTADERLLALNGTVITPLETLRLDKLDYWKNIEQIGKDVSGIGIYHLDLNLPKEWDNTDGAILNMTVMDQEHTSDNKGNENAKLIVNGTEVPVNSVAFKADVKNLLHAGENTIEIHLDTTLGNALIANGTIAATWAGEPEMCNYGITEVTLTPYQNVAVDEKKNDLESAKNAAQAAQAAAEKAQREAEKKAAEAEAAKNSSKEAQRAAEAAKADAQKALAEAKKAQAKAEAAYAKLEFSAQKAKIRTAKSKKKKTVTVILKKVSSADGYVIQYSTNKSFKRAKSVTLKKGASLTKTIKKLKSNKNYFVRAKAYKMIDGKRFYTSYSAKKTVRAK